MLCILLYFVHLDWPRVGNSYVSMPIDYIRAFMNVFKGNKVCLLFYSINNIKSVDSCIVLSTITIKGAIIYMYTGNTILLSKYVDIFECKISWRLETMVTEHNGQLMIFFCIFL